MGQSTKREPRNQQFNLSLTVSELESIRRRAESVGMRPVHFGRALLLEPDRHIVDKSGERSRASVLIYCQLSRLGNNLNQMVRHLHKTGGPLPADLDPLLQDIRRIIARGPA